MGKKKVVVEVDEELKDAAKIQAVKRKTTISDVLRKALRRFVAENGDEEGEG